MSATAPRPWFADQRATVLFFKVNRQPLPQITMWDRGERSAFSHFVDVLPFGVPVRTGRRFRRTWYLGDKDLPADNVLIGHVGWERTGGQQVARFDREHQTWVDAVQGPTGNHAPFLFDGESTRLAVLKHRTFTAATLARVFTLLLNEGEGREGPSVEWDVAPLLDVPSFQAWLERTHAVRRVSFVARLPNPDVLDEFAPLIKRLEDRRASALREEWTAQVPQEGLRDIEADPDARQMIAAAESGYGYVTAQGTTEDGTPTRFNQRQKVRGEATPPLPSSWGEMMDVFVRFALQRLRREEKGQR